jgi:hypothetical protein
VATGLGEAGVAPAGVAGAIVDAEITIVDSFGVRGRTVAIFKLIPWPVAENGNLLTLYKKGEYFLSN